ncbi:hypothetical protein SAMN05192533_107104 [Mesobacillus persicus]|uniref:Uncharacterized protein n=1 Tax=Mesobacillus persicus TaxID=930146 RepID=A0A1H8CHV2_9BACI|nr:hypothetical protein [Mesobacillus persicus]SEM94871.1 hypothetical protein SAMN05192533_107104 [Mesobacillus persicus]
MHRFWRVIDCLLENMHRLLKVIDRLSEVIEKMVTKLCLGVTFVAGNRDSYRDSPGMFAPVSNK